jgi:hypothetical protein
MSLAAFTMPDDDAPAPAPDPFAPVEFRPRGLGSIVICLGPWEIGELQRDDQVTGHYQFRIYGCEGVPAAWRRPLPLADAKDRVVTIVREWIDATPIEGWLITRYLERCGGDRQPKGPR